MAGNAVIDPIVAGVGALMIAGGHVVTAITGKDSAMPLPIRESALLNRFVRIVAIMAIIAIWYLALFKLDRSDLASIGLWLLGATLLSLVGFIVANSTLTVRCDDDPDTYLGGFWLTKNAKSKIDPTQASGAHNPTDAHHYFCGNGRQAGLVWTPLSRACAGAVLALAYAGLLFAGTATLAAGWMLVTVKVESPGKAAKVDQPAKPDKPVTKQVAISSDLLFEYGKADLRPSSTPILQGLARSLRAQNIARIMITGHTDGRGSAAYNQALSERRAAAVYEWLTSAGCMSVFRFTVRGVGSTQPVAPNKHSNGSDFPEGRERNRRVELTYDLSPAGGVSPGSAMDHCSSVVAGR
jgi:outer membrane protein OmpA-like peptidoglycan-associated protein